MNDPNVTGNPPSWWQRVNRKLGSLRPVSWISARSMHHIDRFVYDLSDGQHTAVGLLLGLPVITLTTIGARSGRPRSVPLIGIPDDDRILLIASNWGQERHPAWYHNLRANPQVRVASNGAEGHYDAHETEGAKKEALWRHAVSAYGGYEMYKKRNGGREIPVILLTPRKRP